MSYSTKLGTTEEAMSDNLMMIIISNLTIGSIDYSMDELSEARRHVLITRETVLGDVSQRIATNLLLTIDKAIASKRH